MAVGKSDLYDRLLAVMSDRQRLWFTPPPQGTREADVTAIVCPLVSPESLEVMLDLAGPTDAIEYHHFEVSTEGVPAGTKRWMIRERLENGDYSVLWITISADRQCRAEYQHLR